jgi:hypothetical protein
MTFWQGKYLIVRRDGTVPHWNNLAFVLGPRDPHAQAAILAYVESMVALGEGKYDKAYAESLLKLAESYDPYQAEHGVGDPAERPWRFEAHDVMTALHGTTSVVVVMPDPDNTKTSPPKD